MREKHLLKSYVTKLPSLPGIYVFRDENKKPLYVGKSRNLKSRVSSYFTVSDNTKTARMVSQAKSISYIVVQSELEALLLETRLVKKYMPKYNSELKDDKSPLYIAITKEEYPRVLTLRKTQLPLFRTKFLYGPFIDGVSAKKVLRLARRIFPFSQHKLGKRACIYSQIGLCYPCPSEIVNTRDPQEKKMLKRKYNTSIKNLAKVLSGDLAKVKKELVKRMIEESKREEFEEANATLQKIKLYELITSPTSVEIDSYIKNPHFIEDIREKELKELNKALSAYLKLPKLIRIECYDIAHLAGTYPTASMVTFINGEADKNYYRHFRISRAKKNDDYESMKLVLKRRMKHKEWGMADLIVVDGGKGQVTAAISILEDSVPVIGIAKRLETIIIKKDSEFIELNLSGSALHLIQRMRDEAHRFARRYHHFLVKKAISLK